MASEILECPIDAFLNHYAPFIPFNKSIENALQAFKDHQRSRRSPNPLLEEVDDGGDGRFLTWDNLVPNPVKPDALDEVTTLSLLQEIADFLVGVECCEKDGTDSLRNSLPRSREFSYKYCPSATIKSQILGTDFQVDACITNNPNSEGVVLSDTAVVAVFKKDTKPTNVWDVSHFHLSA